MEAKGVQSRLSSRIGPTEALLKPVKRTAQNDARKTRNGKKGNAMKKTVAMVLLSTFALCQQAMPADTKKETTKSTSRKKSAKAKKTDGGEGGPVKKVPDKT